MNDDDRAWFSAKSHGYGSGLPLRWQGWVVLAIYIALTTGSAYLLREDTLVLFSVATSLTIALMIICARTTRGGWRWRWGEKE